MLFEKDGIGEYMKTYLPAREVAETYAGRKLTDDEYFYFLNYCVKGMEAQVDWEIIQRCAAELI